MQEWVGIISESDLVKGRMSKFKLFTENSFFWFVCYFRQPNDLCSSKDSSVVPLQELCVLAQGSVRVTGLANGLCSLTHISSSSGFYAEFHLQTEPEDFKLKLSWTGVQMWERWGEVKWPLGSLFLWEMLLTGWKAVAQVWRRFRLFAAALVRKLGCKDVCPGSLMDNFRETWYCLILMNYMQIFDQSLQNKIVDGLFKLGNTLEVLFLPVHKPRKQALLRRPSRAWVCSFSPLKFLTSKESEESDCEKCSLISPVLVNAQGAWVFTTWE